MTSAGQPNQADGALEIRVLGELAVLHNGRSIALPRSRKTRALLAYLVIAKHPQQRDRLCRMFWNLPDDPRGALRWSVSKIRQIVNFDGRETLIADRKAVGLRTESISVDLRRVETISNAPSPSVSELEQAADLLKGDFLEGLSLPRCQDFEAWRISLVDDVALLRARILRSLIDRLAGDASRALPHARALQSMHPGDRGLAATVRTLAERARAQATTSSAMPSGESAPPTAPTSPLSEAPPAEGSRLADATPERKHATILALEIVSPLHAFSTMDPELVLRQIDPLFETALAIVKQHGAIISACGDSCITAVFGASPAGDHHAVSACRAAIVLKSMIETQSEGKVRVRAGLDTGEVIIRRRRGDGTERIEVTGPAARIALRLAQSLRRGALAATERTRAAVAGLIDMVRLVRTDFPRFDRDEHAYELRDEKTAG
jgi:DNA-binding SARP family transcriptional activator